MARRLGNVLLWASTLIAGWWLWIAYTNGAFKPEYIARDWTTAIVPAGIVLLIGLTAYYVLAGGDRGAG
jgi:hypothetical protein